MRLQKASPATLLRRSFFPNLRTFGPGGPVSTILPTACPTIAVLSQKGGTGKTTMVRTLADVLRRVGLDVLPVDLDPQGNLSDYFDVDPDASPTIGEVLAGRARAVDAIPQSMI